jgi:hypothetical protein
MNLGTSLKLKSILFFKMMTTFLAAIYLPMPKVSSSQKYARLMALAVEENENVWVQKTKNESLWLATSLLKVH